MVAPLAERVLPASPKSLSKGYSFEIKNGHFADEANNATGGNALLFTGRLLSSFATLFLARSTLSRAGSRGFAASRDLQIPRMPQIVYKTAEVVVLDKPASKRKAAVKQQPN